MPSWAKTAASTFTLYHWKTGGDPAIVCGILEQRGPEVGILVLREQKMGFGHYLMKWLAGSSESCLVSAKPYTPCCSNSKLKDVCTHMLSENQMPKKIHEISVAEAMFIKREIREFPCFFCNMAIPKKVSSSLRG